MLWTAVKEVCGEEREGERTTKTQKIDREREGAGTGEGQRDGEERERERDSDRDSDRESARESERERERESETETETAAEAETETERERGEEGKTERREEGKRERQKEGKRGIRLVFGIQAGHSQVGCFSPGSKHTPHTKSQAKTRARILPMYFSSVFSALAMTTSARRRPVQPSPSGQKNG